MHSFCTRRCHSPFYHCNLCVHLIVSASFQPDHLNISICTERCTICMNGWMVDADGASPTYHCILHSNCNARKKKWAPPHIQLDTFVLNEFMAVPLSGKNWYCVYDIIDFLLQRNHIWRVPTMFQIHAIHFRRMISQIFVTISPISRY